MPTRLDRDRRSRAAGRNNKTSIDLLEHVRGGVQVESRTEMRFVRDFNIDSRKGSTRESAAETNVNRANGRRRYRRRRSPAKSVVPE
jgi:hypothetical protein